MFCRSYKQDTGKLALDVSTPAGTKIEAAGWLDTLPNNLSLSDAKAEVHWGEQSWEEMMLRLSYVADTIATERRSFRTEAAGHRRSRVRLVIASMVTAGILCAHEPVSTKLTWSQEISRIIYKRCASCHSEGGRAPMALTTYEEARPWAKAIKEEVLQRRMPPWGAVKGFGDFRDDESLTQNELARIAEWVEGGAPEGDPIYLRGLELKPSKQTIPAGRRVRRIAGAVRLLGIRPLTTIPSAQVVATLPDGSKIPLLWLRDYKRNWNRTFVYSEAVVLPAGSVVTGLPQHLFEFLVSPLGRSATRLR